MSSTTVDVQLEGKDILILVVLVGSVGAAVKIPQVTGTMAIAFVTAISVWFAGYRVRRLGSGTPRRVPPVRQRFCRGSDGGLEELALKNYGDDDAFYIQVELTDSDDERLGKPLLPDKPPLHIESSESILLADGTQDGLLNEVPPKTDEVRLYYSFVGPTGQREPEVLERQDQREDEELIGKMYSVEEARTVRTEDVSEVLNS